jgi:hypothetical protein
MTGDENLGLLMRPKKKMPKSSLGESYALETNKLLMPESVLKTVSKGFTK